MLLEYIYFDLPKSSLFFSWKVSGKSCPRKWWWASCDWLCVCIRAVQGSMRKASSLSECRLLRVCRSGRRRSSLGNMAALSSGRRRWMRERMARINPSWSCSTAPMSAMPERSEKTRGDRVRVCLRNTNIYLWMLAQLCGWLVYRYADD